MEETMAVEMGAAATTPSATASLAAVNNPRFTIGAIEGAIDHGAEQDIISAFLFQGQSYIFDVDGGTLSDPTLALRDAQGNLVLFNDDGGPGLDARIEFTAPSTGTWHLDVGSVGDGTGTYTLKSRVDDVADDIETTDTVAPEGWRFGHINDGPDQDFYAVTLIGGQRYTFDVVANNNPGETGLIDPTLGVRDNGGNLLAFDDDSGVDLNPHIDFVATYTGTYFLDVGSSGDARGAYILAA
jgi:Bacterial pre-peptidase C-terminal domain